MTLTKHIFRNIYAYAFLILAVIIFFVLVFLGLTKKIDIMLYGECPSEVIGGQRSISFVGYTLSVPDALMTKCFAHTLPDAGGDDAARVTLDARLPDFAPIQRIESSTSSIEDNQVRISISGYEVSGKSTETNQVLIKQSLDELLSKRDKYRQPMYSLSKESVHGFENYISKRPNFFLSDHIYVTKSDNGDVELYVRCVERRVTPKNLWNCSSNRFVLKPGVSYEYNFKFKHLPNARAINQHIQQIIKVK